MSGIRLLRKSPSISKHTLVIMSLQILSHQPGWSCCISGGNFQTPYLHLQGGTAGDISVWDHSVDPISTKMLGKYTSTVSASSIYFWSTLEKNNSTSLADILSCHANVRKGSFLGTPFLWHHSLVKHSFPSPWICIITRLCLRDPPTRISWGWWKCSM